MESREGVRKGGVEASTLEDGGHEVRLGLIKEKGW
jgi:hypothetical protein